MYFFNYDTSEKSEIEIEVPLCMHMHVCVLRECQSVAKETEM